METNNGGLVLLGNENEVTVHEIGAFAELVQAGLNSWRTAGELLVVMIDADPLAKKKIMKQCPSISMDILVAFERIGRKQVFPKLLLDPSPGSKRLLTLPYELQEKYCAEKVRVLLQWNPNDPRYIEKHVQSLTACEVEQVFGVDGARTLEQQHDFIVFRHRPQAQSAARSGRMSAAQHIQRAKVQSCGYYKIVMKNGEPTLIKMDGDFPYAIPVELLGAEDSEPFEIIHLVK